MALINKANTDRLDKERNTIHDTVTFTVFANLLYLMMSVSFRTGITFFAKSPMKFLLQNMMRKSCVNGSFPYLLILISLSMKMQRSKKTIQYMIWHIVKTLFWNCC